MYSQSTCTVDMALIFIRSENYLDARNIDAKCETAVAGVTLNRTEIARTGNNLVQILIGLLKLHVYVCM